MLSPMTPPGTLVVCVNTDPLTNPITGVTGVPSACLVKGRVYTVSKIHELKSKRIGFYYSVLLVEVEPEPSIDPKYKIIGFNPARFKPAVLPKVFTDLLTSTPQDNKVLEKA